MSIKRLQAIVAGAALLLAGFVTVGAPASAEESTFTPTADSYVDANHPSTNFGTKTYVYADGSPVRVSYLKFSVQGASDFASARLTLYPLNNHSTGYTVRSVADTSWGETTITSSNAPSYGPTLASSGKLTAGVPVTLDVTSAVQSNGTVSLALVTASSTAAKTAGRESANPPRLTVGSLPPSPTEYVVSPSGGTYQAVSPSTGTTFTGSLKSVVEAAVADLMAHGGGTVRFVAGTFDLGRDYFRLHDVENIVFEGAGMGATLIKNDNSDAADTEPFNFSGADLITIRDLTVSAGGAPRTTSDALDFDRGNNSVVERVEIIKSRAKGIIFDGKNDTWFAENNIIRDCVITGVPGAGIEFLAASHNLVEGCTITGVGGYGIYAHKSSTSADQPNKKSNDNTIRNNRIDESGKDGINVTSSDRNLVTGNVITNSSNLTTGRDGIRITTADSITCDDNVVSNNVANDTQATKTQKYGLHIYSSLCRRTVVGPGNDFSGNLVAPIRDAGSGTIYR